MQRSAVCFLKVVVKMKNIRTLVFLIILFLLFEQVSGGYALLGCYEAAPSTEFSDCYTVAGTTTDMISLSVPFLQRILVKMLSALEERL